MKLIVGVLANDQGGYSKMVDACRNTCYSKIPEDVSVYYIYGHREGIKIPETYRMDGDCFYNNSSESRANLILKTINFFEYCYNNLEFDYIFRPNCGSYVNLEKLKEKIEKESFPRNEVYMGIEGKCSGIRYASGAGFLISKDVVGEIILSKEYLKYPWNNGFVMDDVSIGELVLNYLRLDITPGSERQELVLNDILDNKYSIDLDCYHFYFKHTIEPRCLYEMHKKILKEKK